MIADMMYKIRGHLEEAVRGITEEEKVGVVRRRLVSMSCGLDVVDVPVLTRPRTGGWYIQTPDMTTLVVVVYDFPFGGASGNLGAYVPDGSGPAPDGRKLGEWEVPFHLAEDPVAEMVDTVIAAIRGQMDARRQQARARW
jgi:hypothetical protein